MGWKPGFGRGCEGSVHSCAYPFEQKHGIWNFEAEFIGDMMNGHLGSSVAVSDHGYSNGSTWYPGSGMVVAGAPDSSGGGYVKLFRTAWSWSSADPWSCAEFLTVSGVEPGDAFGASVALEDGVLIVGSPGDDALNVDSGSTYVFRWTEAYWPSFVAETTLTGYNATPGEGGFGSCVAAEGGLVLIGARGPGGVFADLGSAYLYLHISDSLWFLRAHLQIGGGIGDGLGSSVGLGASTILLSIPGDDDLGADSGSAAFYDL